MLFNIIDFNDDVVTILGKLDDNATKAQITREKIKKLKAEVIPEQNITAQTEKYPFQETKEEQIPEDEIFEDEVGSYIADYDRLKFDFAEDDLMGILPSPTDYRYLDIIRRLQAESIKSILFYKEVIFQEEVDKEELEGIKELIKLENRKKTALTKILEAEKDVTREEAKNKIVLVPTSTGNIRVLEELKAVPMEFRESFKKLIDSIIDGSFKNQKNFKNNRKLSGFQEVKGHQVRIVYDRIGLDTYGLITAFIKKKNNSKGYRESLENKFADYKSIKEDLKEIYQTEEFQQENDSYLSELERILSGEKTTSKKKTKGDKND